MVLVEEGPWGDVQSNLVRIQDRLYTCLDAVLDGQLAEQSPESKGQEVTIQIDCYSLPKSEVTGFFQNFCAGVVENPDYKSAIATSPFVAGIKFAISFG